MIAAGRILFRAELMDALRILERGDLSPRRCAVPGPANSARPSSCPRLHQVRRRFRWQRRRDLLRSAPDVLASTANYLASYGWQRGKGWEPGSANFAVIQQWNKSEVYSKTIDTSQASLPARREVSGGDTD